MEMPEIIYRDDRKPSERIENSLGLGPSGIPYQTKVSVNPVQTTTTVYEQGYQTHPTKPSLLNE
jgi:hypothetical protein